MQQSDLDSRTLRLEDEAEGQSTIEERSEGREKEQQPLQTITPTIRRPFHLHWQEQEDVEEDIRTGQPKSPKYSHSTVSTKLERFDGSDYPQWKFKLRLILEEEGLLECISLPPPQSTSLAYLAWQKHDLRARSIIIRALDNSQIPRVQAATTARQIMEMLDEDYEPISIVSKHFLMEKLFSIRMQEVDTMADHLNQVFTTVNKLKAMGEQISDTQTSFVVLNSLPQSYSQFVHIQRSITPPPSLRQIKAACLQEEQVRQGQRQPMYDLALSAERRKRPTKNPDLYCTHCRKSGHSVRECWSKNGGNKPRNQQQPGQQKRQQQGGGRYSNNRKQGNTAKKEGNIHAFMTRRLALWNSSQVSSIWFLDSGASNHISCRRDWFSNFQEIAQVEVYVADDTPRYATGVGIIMMGMKLPNGKVIEGYLEEVLYVPSFKKNLFSVAQCIRRGHTISFATGQARIYGNEGKLLAVAHEKEDMYTLQCEVHLPQHQQATLQHQQATLQHQQATSQQPTVMANPATRNDEWEKAHRVWGHPSDERLKLVNTNFQLGLTPSKMKECKGCMMGKQHRKPSGKEPVPSADHPLQFISLDLFGPHQRSIGGSIYYATIVDSYSRRVAVAFLKKKSEMFEKFRRYYEVAKQQTGQRCDVLRMDPGGENTSHEFMEWAELEGIQVQLTPTNYPQGNALAERKGGIVADIARCMMKQAQLPDMFWAEAVSHATYLCNLLPTKRTGGDPPEYLFSGTTPHINMHTFGCRAYNWVPKSKRRKNDAKAVECVYIGAAAGGHAHRLYNPKTKRIIVSRDVEFDENLLGLPGSDVNITTHYTTSPTIQQSSREKKNDEKEMVEEQMNEELDDVRNLFISQEGDDEEDEENDEEEEENEEENEASLSPTSSIHEEEGATPAQLEVDTKQKKRRQKKQYNQPVRRGVRTRAPTNFYSPSGLTDVPPKGKKKSTALSSIIQPSCYKQAVEGPQAMEWKTAIQEEMNSILSMGTWQLVPKPEGAKAIPTKWCLTLKHDKKDGSIKRYKARLVARGDKQREGIDYDEVFSPTVRFASTRILLTIAAASDLDVDLIDIKTAYLNGKIDKEIYLMQPEGYVDEQHPDWVCKLVKSIYGIRQAGRIWYQDLDSHLTAMKYPAILSDPCIHIHPGEAADPSFISHHVDDLLASASKEQMVRIKKELAEKYTIVDNGPIEQYLGMQFYRDRATQAIHCYQQGYLKEILKTYGMENCKPAHTPMEVNLQLPKVEATPKEARQLPYPTLVGKLIYLAVGTRPDICYAVNYLSRFMTAYTGQHWKAAQQVLRYLKHTSDYGITLAADDLHKLEGHIDADWGRDLIDRKSTSGYIFFLGGAPITWSCKRQSTVSLSSTESEITCAMQAVKEAKYLRHLLEELGYTPVSPTILHEDNQGCIALTQNPADHARTKHLDVQLQFTRDHVSKQAVKLVYIPSEDNRADILTKPLPRSKFEKCRDLIGVHPIPKQA